jgi:hypothetical protein
MRANFAQRSSSSLPVCFHIGLTQRSCGLPDFARYRVNERCNFRHQKSKRRLIIGDKKEIEPAPSDETQAANAKARFRRERIRPLVGRPYRSGRISLAPLTRDDAAIPIIGRYACTASLLPGSSSRRCGQGRKGGAEDDCRGKCNLGHFGHCPISFVCSPPLRYGCPIRSTTRRAIPGVAKVRAFIQITFSSPIIEAIFIQFVQERMRLPNSAADPWISRPQACASLRRDSHRRIGTDSL